MYLRMFPSCLLPHATFLALLRNMIQSRKKWRALEPRHIKPKMQHFKLHTFSPFHSQTRKLTLLQFPHANHFSLPPAIPKRLAPNINPAIFQKERRDDPIPLQNVLRFLHDGTADQYIYAWIKLKLDRTKKNYAAVTGRAVLPRGVLPADEEQITEQILVFASGNDADDAIQAGASIVGGVELIQQIANGDVDLTHVTRALATPEMYREAIKIAKIIGPMGLMPSAKKGTVTNKVAQAVTALRSEARISFEEKDGMVVVEVAKNGWGEEEVFGNMSALLESIIRSNTNKRKCTY